MTWRTLLTAAALCVAIPVMAQEARVEVEPPVTPAPASEAAPQPPPDAAEQTAPVADAPSAEELQARLESFNEGFVELKNVVDQLSKMKLSGYIQAQYVADERSNDRLQTGSRPTQNFDEFSVRRARVKFTYQFAPTSRFVLQPDVTSSGVSLKDGYVEFTEPWTTWKHTLTAGQFNWPFGFEIMYSSSSREMPERSRVVRTLFPGERDRGVMLSGRGLNERFTYNLALVNGTGTGSNASWDLNQRKDLVGRAAYSFGKVDLGASIYRGRDLVAVTGNAAGADFDKERTGLEVQWITPLPGLGVRGEYIKGKERGADVDGWYAYAIQNVGTRHQFVVRLDQYDPNTDVDDNATRTLGGAYIFHWDANSKVMFAYEKPSLQVGDPKDNVLTVRYQYSF